MQSKGFYWFVLIMGGVLLILSVVAAIVIHDAASLKLLPIYGILYAVYAILFLTSGKAKKKDAKQKEKQSPLMRR